jgi:predicted dehydrogenase
MISVAVVGAGNIGRQHIARIRAHPGARLLAIADPAVPAAALARELSLPLFPDLASLLAELRPDGVVIASPNDRHADDTVLALRAGIPVLVEKPIAHTVEAARRIVEAEARSGVPVLVGHHRRHSAAVAKAREVLASDPLGRIVAVQSTTWFRKPEPYFEAAWRRAPGAGPLLTNMIHDVDLMRHLVGEIVEVRALASNRVRGFAVEDTAAAIATFASGAVGTFLVCDTAASPWSWETTSGEDPVYPRQAEDCYRITGTQGALAMPSLTLWRYETRPDWHEPLPHRRIPYDEYDPLTAEFAHFVNVVAGATPLVGAADAARSLGVIEAIRASAESGAPVAPTAI